MEVSASRGPRIILPRFDWRHLPPKPSTVCASCWTGPFARRLGFLGYTTGGYWYTSSRERLRAGAATGCLWCQLVLSVCGEDLDVRISDGLLGITAKCYIVESDTSHLITPRNTQGLCIIVEDSLRFEGNVFTASDDPAAKDIIGRTRILDVGSLRSLALARTCIERCKREHPRCVALSHSSESFLPTRVVDCSDPDHPRLVPTAGSPGTYIALSYVWGENQPHSTTMSNIQTYTDHIDSSRLPKTITDAIRVTHALGFQYLWADTLCIIQDSDADKRQEIGRMHRIYRDAHLTIIAASANKVSEGFLQDRPAAPCLRDGSVLPDIVLPFIHPLPRYTDNNLTLEDVPKQHVGRVHISPTYTHYRGHIEQYNHAWDPISGRGWCMQEYLMSPRALLFTSQTLQFRCQTATHCIGDAIYDPTDERRIPDVLFLSEPPLLEHHSEDWIGVHAAWRGVVDDYSRRTISVPSDKLVACGAIAEEFHRVLRSDYLAGLWRHTLLDDLLWFKETGSDTPRPAEFRAPSWSWASVDGQVKMGGRGLGGFSHGAAVAEVIQCEVSLEDAALPFGQVVGGSLVLRAALIRCVLHKVGENLYIGLQTAQQARHDEDEVKADTKYSGEWFLDCDADVENTRTWVALLWEDEWWLEGLVVTKAHDHSDAGAATDCSRQVFRRVGFFYVEGLTSGALKDDWDGELPVAEIELA
ncbi:heterokaryon incompatibility protein-domain-containing protein [Trametes gibbosa]|nr:heterokaryon incompatibility protein-domain-containing protein [Trametes gibbosa]